MACAVDGPVFLFFLLTHIFHLDVVFTVGHTLSLNGIVPSCLSH